MIFYVIFYDVLRFSIRQILGQSRAVGTNWVPYVDDVAAVGDPGTMLGVPAFAEPALNLGRRCECRNSLAPTGLPADRVSFLRGRCWMPLQELG